MFPERCYRGVISYLEGERVPKNRGIVTERNGEKFDVSMPVVLGRNKIMVNDTMALLESISTLFICWLLCWCHYASTTV